VKYTTISVTGFLDTLFKMQHVGDNNLEYLTSVPNGHRAESVVFQGRCINP